MLVLPDPTRTPDGGIIHSDGSVDFIADQSMGGNKLTDVEDPTNPQDAATKNYVDAVSRGFDWKDSCRAATTASITLSGAQTIDGVSVVAGNRVLVKNQSTASQNGIYVCAAGSWSRAVDADASSEVTSGLAVTVTEGTANGNKTFVLTTDDPITLGSTSLTFSLLGDGNSGGDVVGPSSSTDNAIVRFDGTSGKLIQNSGVTISDADKLKGKASYSDMASQTGSGTRTLDLNADNIHLVNLTGNGTGAVTNANVGQRFAVRIKQDATGGRTWTWWSGIHWPGDVEPTQATTANRWDWFGFICTGTGEYGAGEFDGFVLGRDYRP